MESQSNINKTLEYVQQKKPNTAAYVQGLISLGVLVVTIVIVIFVYVPNITETKEISTKRKAVETEVAAFQKKYDTIAAYNVSDLADGLKSARVFIPDDIRVAQLATFINQNSKQYGLEVSRLGINEDKTEVKQTVGTETKDKLLGSANAANRVFLGRVEGPFSFRGSRTNIYKFLDFLVMGGFATNFDQVTINAGDKEENWSVNFFTSYYYLEPVSKVESSRALIEVDKSALKPISVDSGSAIPTPDVTTTPTASVTPTATPTVSL